MPGNEHVSSFAGLSVGSWFSLVRSRDWVWVLLLLWSSYAHYRLHMALAWPMLKVGWFAREIFLTSVPSPALSPPFAPAPQRGPDSTFFPLPSSTLLLVVTPSLWTWRVSKGRGILLSWFSLSLAESVCLVWESGFLSVRESLLIQVENIFLPHPPPSGLDRFFPFPSPRCPDATGSAAPTPRSLRLLFHHGDRDGRKSFMPSLQGLLFTPPRPNPHKRLALLTCAARNLSWAPGEASAEEPACECEFGWQQQLPCQLIQHPAPSLGEQASHPVSI